jgi:hypothetical protein
VDEARGTMVITLADGELHAIIGDRSSKLTPVGGDSFYARWFRNDGPEKVVFGDDTAHLGWEDLSEAVKCRWSHDQMARGHHLMLREAEWMFRANDSCAERCTCGSDASESGDREVTNTTRAAAFISMRQIGASLQRAAAGLQQMFVTLHMAGAMLRLEAVVLQLRGAGLQPVSAAPHGLSADMRATGEYLRSGTGALQIPGARSLQFLPANQQGFVATRVRLGAIRQLFAAKHRAFGGRGLTEAPHGQGETNFALPALSEERHGVGKVRGVVSMRSSCAWEMGSVAASYPPSRSAGRFFGRR